MTVWTKLQKLRGKSADEWRTRGAQELAQWQERLFGKGCAEMSDTALQQALQPKASASSLLARLRQPEQTRWLPVFAQRAAVIEQCKLRFPAEAQRLIQQADEICAGRFTLFEQTDFDFGTPLNWRLEPRSGKTTALVHWSKVDYLNPDVAGDKKLTWELNRHQFLITLGQAYWLTGAEKYAERYVQCVTEWIEANPPKQGINWASSLELAFRVIAWTWALYFFAEAWCVTPPFVERMLKSLIQQTEHIETYLSVYFSPNTHLTGEALALLTVGTALPELRQAEHWRQRGERILLEQLPRHVRRDGVYFEQASYYHRYTADFYTHFWLMTHNEAIKPKLAGLFEHLMWITRPDGEATFYGDDDGGKLVMLSARKAANFRDTLAFGATLLQRGDWKFVAGDAPELLWLVGAEGWQSYDALPAATPAAGLKAFGESGYYVMRSGWDEEATYVWMDCGRHGADNGGHAHSDALSFEFAANGVIWFCDPGTFTYTGDAALRNEIRSSFSHTTVSVDGETQSVPNTAFTWRHIAQSLVRECRDDDAEALLIGQQNGYARLRDPVRQQRSFTLLKNNFSLVIRDEMEANNEHRYALHFHAAPDCAIEIADGNRAVVRHTSGRSLQLSWQMQTGTAHRVEWQVTPGWVSRCYGRRQAAPVLTISFQATGKVAWETRLTTETI
jgi:uncharacterized heparinase superfamily protein